jgi:hypothetical protein
MHKTVRAQKQFAEIVPPAGDKSKTFSMLDTPREQKHFCFNVLPLSADIESTYGTSYCRDHRLFAANLEIPIVC